MAGDRDSPHVTQRVPGAFAVGTCLSLRWAQVMRFGDRLLM